MKELKGFGVEERNIIFICKICFDIENGKRQIISCVCLIGWEVNI